MSLRYALSTALLLPCLSSNVQADIITDYATGRTGPYLKSTLQEICRPHSLCQHEHINAALCELYRTESGHISAIMTGDVLQPSNQATTVHRLIPAEWYAVDPELRSATDADLFNLCLTTNETAEIRSTYPLYDVEIQSDGDETWKFGTTDYFGDNGFTCLEPTDEHKGEIARSIFYVVTVYPAKLWTEWGETLLLHNGYPTLSEFALQSYLKWHREYPVTETEMRRNDAVEKLQGNRNPYIDHPDLAEHLWGNRMDEPFGGDGTASDNLPLHSTYTLTGPDINLKSPYIPSDARWKVDGKSVTSGHIRPSDLGVGQHELTYESLNESGKIIITITQ